MTTPAKSPKATAKPNPTTVVMKVCQELSRIGQRHSQPDANTALGAGSTNGSMSNARTTASHKTKIATITTQGSARRSALRRNNGRLRGLAGGASRISGTTIWGTTMITASCRARAGGADVLAQL